MFYQSVSSTDILKFIPFDIPHTSSVIYFCPNFRSQGGTFQLKLIFIQKTPGELCGGTIEVWTLSKFKLLPPPGMAFLRSLGGRGGESITFLMVENVGIPLKGFNAPLAILLSLCLYSGINCQKTSKSETHLIFCHRPVACKGSVW